MYIYAGQVIKKFPRITNRLTTLQKEEGKTHTHTHKDQVDIDHISKVIKDFL